MTLPAIPASAVAGQVPAASRAATGAASPRGVTPVPPPAPAAVGAGGALTPRQALVKAGWDDGADDPPLTSTQVARLAALLAPHIRARVRQKPAA